MQIDAASPGPEAASLERLAVEFADAAYPLARRLGFEGSWLDLELGLRRTLVDAVGTNPPPARASADSDESRTTDGPRRRRRASGVTSAARLWGSRLASAVLSTARQ